MKVLKLSVNETDRLDKFLAKRLEVSRNQVSNLVKNGYVKIDGIIVQKSGLKLKIDNLVEVSIPEPEKSEKVEVDFDVDIIYEDDDILVVNKPINLTVHPAPSVKDATLVDWLKSKNYSLSTISGEERHGIVHRLDKGTSGAMVVAKNNKTHEFLSNQLKDKSMGRYYLALIDLPLKENIEIDRAIGRNPANRLKMGIVNRGKSAKSRFIKLATSSNNFELISAKLYTGRTHQIRVHLSSISRHIFGDSLYGFKSHLAKINRVFLHSYILYLKHPNGENLQFIAPISDDINDFIDRYFDTEIVNEKIDPNFITNSFSNF